MRESLSILGRNRIFTVVFHLVVWTVIFFIPPVFIFWGTGEHALLYQLRMLNGPLTLALVFYVNYLVLCPRLLDNRMSMKKFLLLNLLLYIMGLGLMHLWRCIIDNCFMFFTGDSLPTQCKNIHCLTLWKKVLFNLRDCMLYFFISVLAFLLHTSIKWQEAELAREKAERDNANAHLRILKLQVSPHFLLNTLNNIYALTAINTQKAQEAIQDLSKMLRHILYDYQRSEIELRDEVEFLKNYIRLMKLRQGPSVEVNTSFHITNEQQKVAPMIFISLVENAFKHGVKPAVPCTINITIQANDRQIVCDIVNSNHPKTSTDRSGHGVGLELVRRRLELAYKGRYEWTHGVNDNQKMYHSTITIKL